MPATHTCVGEILQNVIFPSHRLRCCCWCLEICWHVKIVRIFDRGHSLARLHPWGRWGVLQLEEEPWEGLGGQGRGREGGASVITNTPWYFLLWSFHFLTLIDIGAISWYFQHLTNLLVVESHSDSCTSSLFRERKLRRISMNREEGGGRREVID